MKLKMLVLLLLSSMMLVACGGNEKEQNDEVVNTPIVKEEETVKPKVDEIKEEEIEEDLILDLFEDDPVPEKGGIINTDQIKAIIEYHALGADDKLIDVSLHNGEITATVEVVALNSLPASMSAEMVYSRSGDELLLHEGWDVLTIKFGEGIGTVSMNRSQQKDEGVGPYFPTVEIINQLEGK